MIENLHGIQETVNFKTDTNIRLYMNEGRMLSKALACTFRDYYATTE